MKIKVGTRGSKLALHQTRQVIELIRSAQPDCEIEEVIVKTLGDKVQNLPLFKVGGQGLFIKEIENALLDKRIDLAVHSLKDVPHQMSEGLELVAYGLLEDARDCFLSFKFNSLKDTPPGAIIGTSSLRRRAQISAIRNDLKFSDFRGNLDTRLKKLEEGEVDAIILAAAGLKRFDQSDKIGELFAIDQLTPPAGQGIIAVQCRSEDSAAMRAVLKNFACPVSQIRARCERAFLKELQGGCQTPMAIHAMVEQDSITAYSFVGTADASKTIRRVDTGHISEPEKLGQKAAAALIAAGAADLLVKSQEEQSND
jgi:hydroxymethylbilane synthase